MSFKLTWKNLIKPLEVFFQGITAFNRNSERFKFKPKNVWSLKMFFNDSNRTKSFFIHERMFLNCQHFTLENTSRIFPKNFLSHLTTPSRSREFSPVWLRTFPLVPKFIYISVVIQILWNLFTFHERPLSITKRTLLSNHITIERLWWFELVVFFALSLSTQLENYISKISVCWGPTRTKKVL